MLSKTTLGAPVGTIKKNTANVKTASKNYTTLWKYDWISDTRGLDGSKVHLATPVYDPRRKIYVTWDNAVNKIYYTYQDIKDLAKENRPMNGLNWYGLLECYPYFSNGGWNFFNEFSRGGNDEVIPCRINAEAIEFIMTEPKQNTIPIPIHVIVNDKRRRFIAKLGDAYKDLVTDAINKALKDGSDTSVWKDIPLPGPGKLKWDIYVPSSPWSTNGKPDPRLVQINELSNGMSDVIFLLDRNVRNIIYWNKNQNKWRAYVLRDPGWGICLGEQGKWNREGVVFDQQRGVYTWRDPITLTLYAFVKGVDYDVNNKIFKIMRARLHDSLRAMLAIPRLGYDKKRLGIYADITRNQNYISKLKNEIEDYEGSSDAMKIKEAEMKQVEETKKKVKDANITKMGKSLRFKLSELDRFAAVNGEQQIP